jgi:hypothetical protein
MENAFESWMRSRMILVFPLSIFIFIPQKGNGRMEKRKGNRKCGGFICDVTKYFNLFRCLIAVFWFSVVKRSMIYSIRFSLSLELLGKQSTPKFHRLSWCIWTIATHCCISWCFFVTVRFRPTQSIVMSGSFSFWVSLFDIHFTAPSMHSKADFVLKKSQ